VNVIVYNSLEYTRQQYVKISIPISNVQVSSTNGTVLSSQVSSDLSYGATGFAMYFVAQVPAMGYQTYVISPSNTSTQLLQPTIIELGAKDQYLQLANEYLTANFSSVNGQLISVMDNLTQRA
jgi:hypothetical protein